MDNSHANDSSSDWQPTATIDNLKKRAAIIQQIRLFFSEKNVMEVDTPALSEYAVTDVHLQSFETLFNSPYSTTKQKLFLHTSPEFPMKRLLCAGSGCIYQICKVFRNEESGRCHNPEFTLLEWYRVGFDHFQLMDEMDELLQRVLKSRPAKKMTYRQAFLDFLSLDPLDIEFAELKQVCCKHGFENIAENESDKDTLLQLLFCHLIEPQIGQTEPCFVYNFPASQAALAKLSDQDNRVAERFEVYFRGIELANGFNELQDASEQLERFKADNHKRVSAELTEQPIDINLINALHNGLPDCAGVALGIDRLIMLAVGADHINEVISFRSA